MQPNLIGVDNINQFQCQINQSLFCCAGRAAALGG
ncbi:MAG: hypothetical protein BWX84_02383 [Verrucomicrobia bacterium ADurb.Bin118]|nr:MAG: hypothetical protein BWX84_02383 [Verrucomicrobia bacterium ADurb.Bin118]